ncbi:MAG: prohibitin family protein [Candidatus Thorarchaeota archaeon]
MNKKGQNVGAFIFGFVLIVVFILLMLLLMSTYTISAGYRGVILTFGEPSDIIATEGFHMKMPIAQSVKKIEVRTQKIEATADSASKDLQDVQTTIALNFHLIPEEVNKLYQEIGLSYQERIIDPAIQESVKSVSAQFTAEELITKRSEVKAGIKDFLKEKLFDYYIVVDDVNIVNFQFSEQFDAAIEQKVTAEQLKLKAERDLERIQIEAEQKVTQAQAEAEAIRLQAEQIKKNRDILELRAIEKWDGKLPVYNGGGAVPFINVNNEQFTTSA